MAAFRRPRVMPLLATALALVGGFAMFGKRRMPSGASGPGASRPGASESGRGQPTIPANPRARSLGYETEDISAKLVARILAVFAGTAIVSIAILFLMIHFFRNADRADHLALTPQQSAEVVPPGPHLQRAPYQDLHDEQGAEEGKIQAYSWVGQDHRLARIPIDRAMALVAGRSLEPSP